MTATLAAYAMLLTACTAPAEPMRPESLDFDEQLAVFEQSLDAQWKSVTDRYPSAVRPDTTLVRAIDSTDWADVTAACLTGEGITATSDGGQLTIQTQSTRQNNDLAIAEFACRARYPDKTMLGFILSEDERNALFGYYTQFLLPCLRSAGQETPPVPQRDDFVAESFYGPFWHPYNLIWQDVYEPELEIRCPPEPEWAR